MAKLTWDKTGERLFETGVEKCVLFPMTSNGTYSKGVAWNGITAISESPSGAEASKLYANNSLYATLYSAEELGGTIEAYTYPDEFAECDGSVSVVTGMTVGQQPRKAFGLCFRTEVGNDVLDTAYGYKLHFIYGCKASPSERSHSSINDSPEAETLSWEITTTPVDTGIAGMKATASIIIDSTKFTTEAQKTALANLEKYVYGTDGEGSGTGTDPQMPTPAKIKELLTVAG